MPITILDLVLLGVMLISGLLAMVRGFMREILSIAAWGAAALVSSLVNAPLPSDAVYFGEISLSGAVRPVAQTSARLKEAAKLGFGRAILPESARGEPGGDAGLVLNSVGGLTSLVAEIAARGTPRGAREANREPPTEKNATPARFRRENG